MKKYLVYGLGIAVLVGVGAWCWQVNNTHESPVMPLNAAVYPLYQGVAWTAPHSQTSANGSGYEVVSEPISNTTDIAAVSSPFVQYYHDKLLAAGWTQDMNEEAGGPGAEVSVYRKDSEFIVVSFRSDFHVRPENAPEQCPCDVTLSLMSGVQQGETRAQSQAARIYTDAKLGITIALPTSVSTSSSDTLWSVDPSYEYQAMGPGKAISGVKFTIPSDVATGTNLAADTYLSVEQLPANSACDASAFIDAPTVRSTDVQEGTVQYSVASSTDAAVGNRYEEIVYARTGSEPCTAVRYFIHYAAIENFPPGVVQEFNNTALIEQFDQIRRSLRVER